VFDSFLDGVWEARLVVRKGGKNLRRRRESTPGYHRSRGDISGVLKEKKQFHVHLREGQVSEWWEGTRM